MARLDALRAAEYTLRQSFLAAYRPNVGPLPPLFQFFQVIGSTCDLVARRGDYIYNKIEQTDNVWEKEKLKVSIVTHLILDEASQLPPHQALAVYIMLPGLQKVTLIGEIISSN